MNELTSTRNEAPARVERARADLSRPIPEQARGDVFAAPPVDIYQNGGGWLIRADLPGVSLDDVDLNLEENRLRIEAKRGGSPDGKVHFGHAPLQKYRRTLIIPDVVDPDGIEARLTDGVLEVKLPRDERTRARKIEISAS